MPSLVASNVKSALNNVSANATTQFPIKESFAHKTAWAVPNGSF